MAIGILGGVSAGGIDQDCVFGKPPIAVARATDAGDRRRGCSPGERELETRIESGRWFSPIPEGRSKTYQGKSYRKSRLPRLAVLRVASASFILSLRTPVVVFKLLGGETFGNLRRSLFFGVATESS